MPIKAVLSLLINRKMSSPVKKKANMGVSPAKKKMYPMFGKENAANPYAGGFVGPAAAPGLEGWEKYETNQGKVFYVKEDKPNLDDIIVDLCSPEKKAVAKEDASPKNTPPKSHDTPQTAPETPAKKSPDWSLSSIDSMRATYCENCKKNYCVVTEYMDEAHELMDHLRASGHENHHARKEMYRFYSRVCHGYLGKGIRKPLPVCVIMNVRHQFPEEDDNYMGFKKKAANTDGNESDSSSSVEFEF